MRAQASMLRGQSMEQLWAFVAIAEIAGVFVGFGALISVTQQGEIDYFEHGLVRGCVTSGLLAMAGSLFPSGIAFYGVEEHALWMLSAALLLALDWLVIFVMNRTPDNRRFLADARRSKPWLWRSFWSLEVGLQVPLWLIVFGATSALDVALYATAVLFCLAQAGYVLGILVYVQRSTLPSQDS